MSEEQRDKAIASETFTRVVALLTNAFGAPAAVYCERREYPTERWFATWGHADASGDAPRCIKNARDAIRLTVEDRRTECIVFGVYAQNGHVVDSTGDGWKTLWLSIGADGSLVVGHHTWCREKNPECVCWTKEQPHWVDLSLEEFFVVVHALLARAARELVAARRRAFWSVTPNHGRCASAQALCESR